MAAHPAFLAALALALASCASAPAVRVASDSSVDFRQYQTFGFAKPLGTDQGDYQSVLSGYLVASSRREMEARGLRYDPAQPQLLVNFGARVDDKTRVTTTPAPMQPMMMGPPRGYYGYRASAYGVWPAYRDETTVTQYQEGTLNIDVADAARRQLVWEAVVTKAVSSKDRADLQTAVDGAVTAAFKSFPVAPKAPG